MQKDTKEKKLFECKSIFNLEVFQKIFHNFKTTFWIDTIYVIFLFSILYLILCLILKSSMYEYFTVVIIFSIIKILVNKLKINDMATKYFQKIYKNDLNYQIESKTIFYEKYLERISSDTKQIVNYDEIKVIKENDTDIFIGTKKGILTFQKDKCNEEIINFIKNISPNKKVYKKAKNIKIKTKESTDKQSKLIKTILNILFILSIISVWLGMYCWATLTENINPHFGLEYSYYMAIALPIPLLSLILGLIYEKKGYKTDKNIVIGIVMSIPFIISLIPPIYMRQFYIPMNNINEYKNIIKVDLPTTGKYKKIKWDSPKGAISNYIEFNNKKEIDKFYKDIKNDSTWIKENDINIELNDLANPITSKLSCNSKECIYLIYNKDEKTYNKLPSKTGKYKMTLIMYDPDINTLQIEEIIYEYKK